MDVAVGIPDRRRGSLRGPKYVGPEYVAAQPRCGLDFERPFGGALPGLMYGLPRDAAKPPHRRLAADDLDCALPRALWCRLFHPPQSMPCENNCQ